MTFAMILRRFGMLLLVIWAASTLIFFVPRLSPTNPVRDKLLAATEQGASASDMTELASLALNASLPTGFFPASDAVTLEPVTVPALADDGSARWTMRAERAIVQSVDERLVTQLVFGQSTRAAQIRMDEFLPAESAPKIIMSPSWWAWIPILPFRIEVVTE